MVKRIFLLGFILCNICFCITAGAAQIEDYGRYNMRVRPDRAVSGPPFQTSLGELRIEFTNNTKNSEAERCHMSGYLDGVQIINVNWPDPKGIYYMRVFEDVSLKRLYIGMQNKTRLRMLAYDKRSKTLSKVLDSNDMYNGGGTEPVIGVKDGELVVLFSVPDGAYGQRYKCVWVPAQGRFIYEDITKQQPYIAPEVEKETDTESEETDSKEAENKQSIWETESSAKDSIIVQPEEKPFEEEDYSWNIK